MKALGVCSEPTCGRLVRSGRCAEHKLPPRHDARPHHSERGYGNKGWPQVRKAYAAAHPMCELQLTGCRMAMRDVDHIVPLDQGGARLDWSNLQSLCRPCHRRKTAADKRRMTRRVLDTVAAWDM